MIKDALLAYVHYIAIILAFSFLTAELVLIRQTIDARAAKLLARFDAVYGAAAVALIVTGLLRVFMGAKGPAFYMGNPVFWTKIGVFAAVALLSIRPTLQFIRWSRQAAGDVGFVVEQTQQRRMRVYVMLQIHLLALVPLLAVLMSRGVGY